MSIKIILTADDFGPIEFVNQGVYHHAMQGNIDSTQVLVNMNEADLKASLKKLHSYIPADRTFDLGVHFTITSGAPLTGGDNDDAKKKCWGKMSRKKKGKLLFKDYTKFYFGYEEYLDKIEKEFVAQRDTLFRLVDKVNTELGKVKLVVTCASSHHNLFTIAPKLFEAYVKVAQGGKKSLAIRSPKALTYATAKLYYNLVLPLRNLSDRKSDRKLMEEMCFNFSNNKYTKEREVVIDSPAYIDIEFYKGLGSLGEGRLTRTKVEDRKEVFGDMITRAKKYSPNQDIEPATAIVEFVFHLGAGDEKTKELSFKQIGKDYPGISVKYFDNRQTEVLGLNDLSTDPRYREYITTKVSWDECGKVTYRKIK